jgi:16S rRNA (cytosine1402-N4)-methyltransferase
MDGESMPQIEFSHEPVLLSEAIDALDIKPDGIYADCTAGGGGHSFEIVKRLSSGHLFCIDQDEEAIEAVKKRLGGFEDRYTVIRSNFSEAEKIFKDITLDGALMDIGVSSHQIDDPSRGFSYMQDAPLDMRMDSDNPFTAADIVNGYDETRLADILKRWGEEKYARRIAAAIVKQRQIQPIAGTLELVGIIESAVPGNYRSLGGHPAKRSFQALRIEVNHEIEILTPTIEALVDRLSIGGRIAIITFHSLEDREVKQAFTELSKGCICPSDFPVCVCGRKPKVKVFKPVVPGETELKNNPRSHSARLRYAEKLPGPYEKAD